MAKESKSEVMHLRIPSDIHAKIKNIAKVNDRSAHYIALTLMKKGLVLIEKGLEAK
jgi:predicted transcriptional regulator